MTHVYRFDDVQIDIQSFRLSKAGKIIQVEPKTLNLLIFLVENRGRLVERRELIDAVWGDAFVTDHVLNYSIGQLRKGLADDAKNPRYIETVPTRGYRFIAAVEVELPEIIAAIPASPKLDPALQTAHLKQLEVTPHSPTDGFSIPAAASFPGRNTAIVLGVVMLTIACVAAYWLESRRGNPPGGAAIRSLAVLPLENLSGDTSQDYLADGMTDELITGLGQISALRVISRTTAMQYKNAHKPLPQIAKELNIEAVVEGSVIRSGDRIRIAAQLIEAPADKQFWARSFDGDLKDVLGLQSQVATAVADQIRIKLTPQEQTQLTDSRQVNTQAYEAFLKGHFFEQNTPETEQKALQYFRQAVELDPKFARAYVGIARTYNFLAGWEVVPAGEAAASSDAAVAKALELDPDLAEAYGERGWTRMFFHWDFPGAERDFRRALGLDPGSADNYDGLSDYYAANGRFEESLKEGKRALDLDPLSLVINTDYCRVLEYAHKLDDAIAQCKATLELDPNYRYALYAVGELFERKGETSEAGKVWAVLGCDAGCVAVGDEIRDSAGAGGDARSAAQMPKNEPNPYYVSRAYASLGKKDLAFDWLEKAYERRAGGNRMTFLAVDPAFDSLRSDPRFDAFLHRAGLPPQPRFSSIQSKR